MGNPLEVTEEDIAKLDDATFRKLIRLLCEADFRRAQLPLSSITAGGHQDAKDGGLDVKVASSNAAPRDSFIPRKNTGFQVKISKMPPAAITKEMKPRGKLRNAIIQLVSKSGAYVICSSKDSVTGTALDARKKAMQDAVAPLCTSKRRIATDFFGGDRIAQWTSLHPSLVAFVRDKCGRPIQGWNGYGNWANSRSDISEEYIIDGTIRAYDRTNVMDEGRTILAAIDLIRERLRKPQSTVRLVGLSGTGKTRLAQALFDDRISSNPLNQDLALYTDAARNPQPDPQALLEFLIADRRSAVIIVDNCPRDLHARLTTVCNSSQSLLSVLTIEYDVQDEIPEETSIFKLEPASDDVVERLLITRFPRLSAVDRQHIARVSGGNARVAIAIAGTVQPNQSVSHLRSEELFARLFWQGTEKDGTLLRCAEAFSLVYSFDGESHSDDSEVAILAKCCALQKGELIRAIALLKRRNLIQSRDSWRALLPHAIANHLARNVLSTIPRDYLLSCMLCSTERLFRSFTRRLSYLYDAPEAVEIAKALLASNGWLGKHLARLNQFGMTVLGNIAPVAPIDTLAAIERIASESGERFFEEYDSFSQRIIAKTLWHLAYEPVQFERAVALLAQLAARERYVNNGTARRFLKSLFRSHLSGTTAPPQMRAKVLERLLGNEGVIGRLAIELLKSAFTDEHSHFNQDFEFGGRSRNYGYVPQSQTEASEWFSAFFNVGLRVAISKSVFAADVKSVLATGFYNAWAEAGAHEVAAKLAVSLHRHGAWPEGWARLRDILARRKWLSPASVALAEKLEGEIAPLSAANRLRAFLCSDGYSSFALVCDEEIKNSEDYVKARVQLEEACRAIGRQLACDGELFALKSELFQANNQLFSIGIGIAQGARDVEATFSELLAGYKACDASGCVAVLQGFLAGITDINESYINPLLTQVESELPAILPILQLSVPVDSLGLLRLENVLRAKTADANSFRGLSIPHVQRSISDSALIKLCHHLQQLDSGDDVALHILETRLCDARTQKNSRLMTAFGREFLMTYYPKFRDSNTPHRDYSLAALADKCVAGKSGAKVAKRLLDVLATEAVDYEIAAHSHPNLLAKIAALQPLHFLDTFLGGDRTWRDYWSDILDSTCAIGSPLNAISDESLLKWCSGDHDKVLKVAQSIVPFSTPKDSEQMVWKPIALEILRLSVRKTSVLDAFFESLFGLSTWRGRRSTILEKRIVLLDKFLAYESDSVVNWTKDARERVENLIAKLQREEQAEIRERSTGFEDWV